MSFSIGLNSVLDQNFQASVNFSSVTILAPPLMERIVKHHIFPKKVFFFFKRIVKFSSYTPIIFHCSPTKSFLFLSKFQRHPSSHVIHPTYNRKGGKDLNETKIIFPKTLYRLFKIEGRTWDKSHIFRDEIEINPL